MRLIARFLRRLRRQAGLTIVESMVAGLVLATGIGGGYSVFITSASTEADAERHAIGTQQAERAVEEMRGLDYEDLKLTQAPATPSGASDPNSAVEGTQLRAKPDLLEDLVLPGDDSPGDPSITPFETFQLDASNSPVTVDVYRFVSWRDEECPAIDLTELKDEADDVRDQLGTVNQQLELLGASSGELDDLVTDTNAALARRPLVAGLLSSLTSTLSPVVPGANELNAAVDQIRGPLADLEGPIEQLADSNLSGTADLCDLDTKTLRRLRNLRTVKLLVTELSDPLNDVRASVAAIDAKVHQIATASLLTLPTVVTTNLLTMPALNVDFANDRGEVLDALQTLKEDLTWGDDDLGEIAQEMSTELIAAIESLLNTENTTHNTKRLTVAVVLKTSKGSKPPVWVSSVVTDPDDGLLPE